MNSFIIQIVLIVVMVGNGTPLQGMLLPRRVNPRSMQMPSLRQPVTNQSFGSRTTFTAPPQTRMQMFWAAMSKSAQQISNSLKKFFVLNKPVAQRFVKSYVPLMKENKIEKLFEQMNAVLDLFVFPRQEDITGFQKLVEQSGYNPLNRYAFDIKKQGEYSFFFKLIRAFYVDYEESSPSERQAMLDGIKTFHSMGAQPQDKEYEEMHAFVREVPQLFRLLKNAGVIDFKKEDPQVKE